MPVQAKNIRRAKRDDMILLSKLHEKLNHVFGWEKGDAHPVKIIKMHTTENYLGSSVTLVHFQVWEDEHKKIRVNRMKKLVDGFFKATGSEVFFIYDAKICTLIFMPTQNGGILEQKSRLSPNEYF